MSTVRPTWPRRLLALLPYLIATVALVWVGLRVDFAALGRAMAKVAVGRFLLVSLVLLLLNCAADTFAMGQVFGRFGSHVPFRKLFLVRGATYLLAIVNYHMGQAAIVGYLHRFYRVPILRAGGWILFIVGINIATLFIFGSVGAFWFAQTIPELRWIPIGLGVGVVVYAALLRWRPGFIFNRSLFRPLAEAGASGHARAVLVRIPHVFVLVVWHYVAMAMFSISIPPGAALVLLPTYFAVASLPVNVNGFGLAQWAALLFFSPYVTEAAGIDSRAAREAQVMAYSLATSTISILFQVVLGLICIKLMPALQTIPEELAADTGEANAQP